MTLAKVNPKTVAVTWAAAIIFIMLTGHAYSSSDPRDTFNIMKPGNTEKAPDFTLKDTAGREISLSDYRGKALFVTFWATW